jgi:hypothetical protein
MSNKCDTEQASAPPINLIQRLEYKIKETEKRLEDLRTAYIALKRNPEIEELLILLRKQL